MQKAKMRSMQRGALKSDRTPEKIDVYKDHDPVIREQERLHFGVDNEGIAQFAESLRTTVAAFANAGYRKPVDVARLLNKNSVKTFAGQAWTPRLAWFLLKFLYGDRPQKPRVDKSQAAPKEKSAPPSKPRKKEKAAAKKPAGERVPLSQDELARRAAALAAAVAAPKSGI